VEGSISQSGVWRVLKRLDSLLDGVVIDDNKVFNDQLREWEHFYNYHRPHGGLGGQTPYERLKRARRPGCKQPPSVAQGRVRDRC
jgi:transposase InsO family protein